MTRVIADLDFLFLLPGELASPPLSSLLQLAILWATQTRMILVVDIMSPICEVLVTLGLAQPSAGGVQFPSLPSLFVNALSSGPTT